MSARMNLGTIDDEEDDDLDDVEHNICWSNLLFLPFHPVFKGIVLIVVVIKTILGPIQAVYPIVYCWDTLDNEPFYLLKIVYIYLCDPIYSVDTLLHILHKQITDEAVKREFLPKSGFLICLDIISIIPFYSLQTYTPCSPAKLIPNLFAFSEFLIIYRVAETFSLLTTHEPWKIIIGFTLVLIISINFLTSFFLLITTLGFCRKCNNGIYDWRKFVIHKLNETDESFTTYVYAATLIVSFILNNQFDETKPSTLLEYIVLDFLMLIGYLVFTFIVIPKMVAESMLRLRRTGSFYPKVQRIVEETQRRNITGRAHLDVKNFYSLMWNKRCGITYIPEVISELPRYLRIQIRQDLVWPIFYHSPTFRKTSSAYKRWLCENVRIDYKLPDEYFFARPNSKTHLYYIKSGMVQLMSCDDGVTPLISLTGGTILGDISFYVPPKQRKVIVKCITYCEVLFITRKNILLSLHKYPEERRTVIQQAIERMKHARTLYTCKQLIRGLDRSEDEGIAWVKRRWWEISETIRDWKQVCSRRENFKCTLPSEETVYHCAKYIGQLVLCSQEQLSTKSTFTHTKFPWIFVPYSTFIIFWNRIVVLTVFMVLIFYPPNLTRKNVPIWFIFIQYWTDAVYLCDICITILTAMEGQELVGNSYADVIFARSRSVKFHIDLAATIWIESFASISGYGQYYYPLQLNRLIKIYMVFPKWNMTTDPVFDENCKIALLCIFFGYFVSYIIYFMVQNIESLTTPYFFGEIFCNMTTPNNECDYENVHPTVIALSWTLEHIFYEYLPKSITDIYICIIVCYFGILIYIFCESDLIAAYYLKYREIVNYQYFVLNMIHHYEHHKIHPDLLMRLNRYMVCHWKYYKGMDVLHPNLLMNEPYDVFWKLHGEVAEKIIKGCPQFPLAEPELIKQLAHSVKFLVLPKYSTLSVFGIHTKTITWVVQGCLKAVYHDLQGERHKKIFYPGDFVSSCAVFLGKPSLRTVTATTEVEVLYMRVQDFFHIIKHFPDTNVHFEECLYEIRPRYNQMLENYVKKYKDYRKKMREHNSPLYVPYSDNVPVKRIYELFWINPNSRFIKGWMLFRVVVVVVSIISASLQGGSGAAVRVPLIYIGQICDIVGYIDIIIKGFIGFYNDKGILITDIGACWKYYLSRAFVFDLLGCIPLFFVVNIILPKSINQNNKVLCNTACKFAHLYLVMGYFNYLSDLPTRNIAFYMIWLMLLASDGFTDSCGLLILKLQIMNVLVFFGTSHYFVSTCISFNWDYYGKLLNMTRLDSCWLPHFIHLDEHPTLDQLHMVYAESFNLAQSGLMRFNLGKFRIDRSNLGVGITLIILGVMFWYVICYSLTLLVLNFRGNTLFQHGVGQLRRFLKAERVNHEIIEQAINHFRYWWFRTKGINIQSLMNERIGVVFRQDLAYYFFKTTIEATDTLLRGGEGLERQLVSLATQWYFLPGEVIVREMDLSPWIYIVHRGKIRINREQSSPVTLTKGSIFGQLDGSKPRPVRVTAVADGYADLLQISIKNFQDVIDDETREHIAHNVQAKFDFMAVSNIVEEDPYNTIQYILRGRKMIKLPWMKEKMRAKPGTRYTRWLYLTWLFAPFASTCIVLIVISMPPLQHSMVIWFLFVSDIIHFLYLLSELYTIELTVENKQCVGKLQMFRMFRKCEYYIDILSIIIPVISALSDTPMYHLGRLLRLRLFYNFHQHFCRGFKSHLGPLLLKLLIVLVTIHGMTCGWIYVACHDRIFPIELPDLPPHINKTIDYDEWASPLDRKGGCSRITKIFYVNGTAKFSFLVPRHWSADYIVALMYVFVVYTHTEIDLVAALTLQEIYYKILINYIIHIMQIWILSVAISSIYTKFRELYTYDYEVISLILFLEKSGLSPVLLESVKEYTKQLWQRQRGNWLPELARQAPQCLQEDILSALYMHHFETLPLFRELPIYFRRQLVTRLQRVVIFPGKFIVEEGDLFSCLYLIHEGEVEKWYTDKSGEKKMVSTLTTNGYFGLIPAVFPNTPFQFSYYSRTVVDCALLSFKDWQDLLQGYPNIKYDLYKNAKQLKKQLII